LEKFVKKLLYVCEADSGGIMEYAIRQSAAISREGVEVHFLCKPSFPVERLADGIRVWEFGKSRGSRDKRRGLPGKIFRVWQMIADLRSEARQVAELATKLAQTSSTRHTLPATRYSVEDASHQLPVTRHNLGAAEVCVLFACYKEYFAPFWVWPLRRLEKRGIVIGTIAHDPVRDFVVGPLWWHRWSVRLGYSFVRDVFVHDDTPVDFGGRKPSEIRIHQIPHGPYEVAEPKIGQLEMRRRLSFSSDLTTEDTGGTESINNLQGKDLPHGGTAHTEREASEAWPRLSFQAGASEPDSLTSKLAESPVSESLTRSASVPASSPATSHSPPVTAPQASSASSHATSYPLPATPASPDIIFLAFGQIRDGKNLDLFLRAMTRLPENVKLLVAGKGDSGSSRPAEYYQNLAEELGVGDRCRWDIRRIPDEEVGDIFAACDVVLLTYSANFRSASGVLNAAVSARKPVLASCGGGPLKTVVEKYHLGVFVGSDDFEEIVRGASKFVPNSATEQPATRHSLHATPPPAWDRYECENSWEENARRVSHAAFNLSLSLRGQALILDI
jgi:glycosyltransferase involved in cell wall biosynthesis